VVLTSVDANVVPLHVAVPFAVPSIFIVTACPASLQVPLTPKVLESVVLLIQLLFTGEVMAMVGAELSAVKVALGPLAVSAFPALSDHAELPSEILTVPFPEHPVIVTLLEVAPAPEVVGVQPVLVPFKVIPELIVVLFNDPRLVSVNVNV